MDRIEFRIATPADDPDLRGLLRTNPMPGEMSVSLRREPDALAAGTISGDPHYTIIARDTSARRPVGMGSRAVYDGFLNGAAQRIGYLSQLRVDRAYRGRIRLLSEGYRLLRSLRGPNDLPFDLTTIVADNRAALRVLGAGVRDLPAYREIETFTTAIIPLWRRRRPPASREFAIERGTIEVIAEIAKCLERNAARFQFAPRWTAADLLSPARSRSLAPHDFIIATAGGNLVGCLAVWDQTSFKQIVVHEYGAAMRAWRPAIDLAAHLAGMPRLPAPGTPLPHVFLSHVAVDDDREDVFRALFMTASNAARASGRVFLVAGFAARHPFLRVIRRTCRCWTYSSIIYAVCWDGQEPDTALVKGRIPHLEVALL